ncbi:hypothetical protein DIPPA_02967 [Diplonema papillatum]|nr:hypothetical protein DIPPA_02967 [Diplonema papillatum]|eukprot:gene4486-6955_t
MRDPRTGLPLISKIPAELSEFQSLSNAVLVWIGPVVVYDQDFNGSSQVLMISDDSLFVCDQSSMVQRSFHVTKIETVYISEDKDILFVMPDEYDFFFSPHGGRIEAPQLLRVVRRLYACHSGGTTMAIKSRPLTPRSEKLQRLTPPPGWKRNVALLKNRDTLKDTKKQREELETSLGKPLDDAVANELLRIKDGLKMQVEVEYGVEVDRLKARIAQLEAGQGQGTGLPDGPVHGRTPDRVSELEADLKRTEGQLVRCKEALRHAIGEQNSEIDHIRSQFLEYDREVVAYLNKMFTKFPNARRSLGTPPKLVPSGPSFGSPQPRPASPQMLTPAEARAGRDGAPDSPVDPRKRPSYHWNGKTQIATPNLSAARTSSPPKPRTRWKTQAASSRWFADEPR